MNLNEQSCRSPKRKSPTISSAAKKKKVTPEKGDVRKGKKIGKQNWNDFARNDDLLS